MYHIIKNITFIMFVGVLCTFGSLISTAISAENTSSVQKELWTGKIYSSTFKVGACIDTNNHVHGVLYLRLKDGKVDTYSFSGNKDNNGVLNLRHNSGHLFTGKFDSDTVISGKIKTKNGYIVELKGQRTQNAPLGARCEPLNKE